MQDTTNENQGFKNILSFIGKIFSIAIIVILFLIGAFLLYFVVSSRMNAADPEFRPKYNLFTIISGSMRPVIKEYDVVVAVRVDDPATIKVGDIITFVSTSAISRDMVVTHRVMAIRQVDGKFEFVTKGDNNLSADGATAREENIIGRVAFKIPQLGRLQYFIARWYGWLIVVLIPALGIIIYDSLKLMRIVGVKKVSDNLEKMGDDPNKVAKDNEEKMISEVFENINKTQDSVEKKDFFDNDNNALEELKALAAGIEDGPVMEPLPDADNELLMILGETSTAKEEPVVETPLVEEIPVVEEVIPETPIVEEIPLQEPEVTEEAIEENIEDTMTFDPKLEDTLRDLREYINNSIKDETLTFEEARSFAPLIDENSAATLIDEVASAKVEPLPLPQNLPVIDKTDIKDQMTYEEYKEYLAEKKAQEQAIKDQLRQAVKKEKKQQEYKEKYGPNFNKEQPVEQEGGPNKYHKSNRKRRKRPNRHNNQGKFNMQRRDDFKKN